LPPPGLVSEAVVLRAEKAVVIEDLNGIFSRSGVVVVAHYKGLTVAEMGTLRGQMRAAGASLRVTKNRLAKKALEGTPFAPMADMFTGPTAIAVSSDPTAAPKVVVEYARRNEKLQLVGGGLAGTLLDPAAVRALAELPSLDELRARLLSVINTPASRLVGLTQAPGAQLARVLKAWADKQAA
jgi:large subunit ribosomal protein L10